MYVVSDTQLSISDSIRVSSSDVESAVTVTQVLSKKNKIKDDVKPHSNLMNMLLHMLNQSFAYLFHDYF